MALQFMEGLEEGFPMLCDMSLKNSENFYFCFQLTLLHSVSYLFFFRQLQSSSLTIDFDAISSNMDNFTLIQPIY